MLSQVTYLKDITEWRTLDKKTGRRKKLNLNDNGLFEFIII